jgi:methylenetetrahydrofolate dehydrogenase (NADP+)/methenyltetrahydrofolate cyclohydrolase
MDTFILNGAQEASLLEESLKKRYETLQSLSLEKPHLAIILIGDHEPSLRYVAAKQKAAARVGFETTLHHLEAHVSKNHVLDLIASLNADSTVHGIIVQLPAPDTFISLDLINAVTPSKDVDGLTFCNAGHLFQGADRGIVPCTPLAALHLMRQTFNVLSGLDVVVIGQSLLVGRPLSLLLAKEGATVTMVQKETKNIKRYTKEADAVIVAVGQPAFFDRSYFSEKTCIIDVGINKNPHEENTLIGDVDFENCFGFVKALTPVPGGVGPLTVAYLLQNLLHAWEKSR